MEYGHIDYFNLHSRPITQVRFGIEGDLIFASSVDAYISVWNIHGKHIGTLIGHNGSIFDFLVEYDSPVSCSADKKVLKWDLNKGCNILEQGFQSFPRVIEQVDNNNCIVICDDSYDHKPTVYSLDFRAKLNEIVELDIIPTAACYFSNNLVIGSENGELFKYDMRNKQSIMKTVHNSRINEMKKSYCKTFFTTSSKDSSSKVIDYDLEVNRTFNSNEPLNSSSLFPTNDLHITAGGICARDVTLTGGNQTFSLNFYNAYTTEYFGSYSPHFGTINKICVHPSGKYVLSGGEDAKVCFLTLGEDFLQQRKSAMETILNK